LAEPTLPKQAFFDVANGADVKPLLPVVTQEIGDGWLYGRRRAVRESR
jgi:hypothetical protein